MSTGLDEYLNFLDRKTNQGFGDFKPEPYHDEELDSLSVRIRNVPSYSKRITPLLTIFLAEGDNTLVGCKVKGIRRVLIETCEESIGGGAGNL